MSQKPHKSHRYTRTVVLSKDKRDDGSRKTGAMMEMAIWTRSRRDPQHVRQGKAKRGAK